MHNLHKWKKLSWCLCWISFANFPLQWFVWGIKLALSYSIWIKALFTISSHFRLNLISITCLKNWLDVGRPGYTAITIQEYCFVSKIAASAKLGWENSTGAVEIFTPRNSFHPEWCLVFFLSSRASSLNSPSNLGDSEELDSPKRWRLYENIDPDRWKPFLLEEGSTFAMLFCCAKRDWQVLHYLQFLKQNLLWQEIPCSGYFWPAVAIWNRWMSASLEHCFSALEVCITAICMVRNLENS